MAVFHRATRCRPLALAGALVATLVAYTALPVQADGGSTWRLVAPMATARELFAAATGGDGRTYVIGGATAHGLISSVEAYTTRTNAWTGVASISSSRFGLAAVAGRHGQIYVMGGFNDQRDSVSTVETYSLASNTWTPATPMLMTRYGLAAASTPDGRIYAMGGFSDDVHPGYIKTVEVYRPTTNAWSMVAPMSTSRYLHAAAAGRDGRIYAMGGLSPTGAILDSVEVYTPGTNTWTAVAPMLTPRADVAAVTGANGLIYVLGGFGPQGVLKTVEAYNPRTNSWHRVASMSQERGAPGGALGRDHRIYAMGGDNHGYLSSVEALATGDQRGDESEDSNDQGVTGDNNSGQDAPALIPGQLQVDEMPSGNHP